MQMIFFKYKNQREPPSQSDRGKLRSGTRSDILGCLPGMPGPGRTLAAREASVVVLDMAAVVHIIKPQRASVFGEYTKMQLLPYLESHMMDSTTRVEAIWVGHLYGDKSQVRNSGWDCISRTRVSDKIPIPKGAQWQLFVKDRQNRDELYQFISLELQRNTVNSQYHLLTTKADIVLSNKPTDLSDLSPCRQEEADTRMMLHLHHAADHGHTKAYLRTVDSDVVVLATHFFHDLGLSELWIGFGSRKKVQRHSNPPYLSNAGTTALSSSALLPSLHRLTLCLPWWESARRLHGMHG